MDTRPKILLVDDSPELLEIYAELLKNLPSEPEIHTANSGTRALAMLEGEEYRLLICDLKMPKVAGLQVLSIVRRKYPQLRTVALTSVVDEQFRSRAYALGVDLFWNKPGTEHDSQMLLECIEALLGQDNEGGFRGLQSKSLVDIIQLECLSQSSSVLRITNGALMAKIWIHDGEIIDAETEDLRGEESLMRILAWRAGSFETLPAEPTRPRTIFKPYNALLLESAHALDEARSKGDPDHSRAASISSSALAQLSQVEGVEFVLALKPGEETPQVARGLENPKAVSAWAWRTMEGFRELGDVLRAGPLRSIECAGPQRNVALASQEQTHFCVGWKHSMELDDIRDMMKRILALWAS